MHTPSERFAEFNSTTIDYARVRVVIEDPKFPQTVTSAIMIDRHWLDDFRLEAECRQRLDDLSRRRSRLVHVDEYELRHCVTELQRAEQRAREARELLSLQVARSLSDFYGKEHSK